MENANYTVNASGLKIKSSSEQLSFDENERFDSSKPYQPGPLKLQIKSIKNSTRTDVTLTDNMILNDGEGRSLTLVTATVMLTWVVVRFVKRLFSFTLVSGVDFLWTWLKNKLGYANDHYETYITLGNEHPPFRPHLHLHRHDLHGPHHPEDHPHGHHDFHGPHHPEDKHHGHHKPQDHGHHHGWPTHGWPNKPPQGSEVYDVVGVRKKPYYWYHPATKFFEQPTIQYLPHGTKYALYGFDQHQAYKYHKKYEGKFEKYKTKLYRKKTKKEEKAKRKKQKAVKKWKKRQKRRKKAQAFASRVKNWLGVKDKKKAGDDDDDDDGGDGGDGGDDDDTNDDIGEGNWEKPSSELEHGGPPKSHYTQTQDYDALPIMNNNQHFLRITGG